MSENRPFVDHAGLQRCPHCAAPVVVIFCRTVHRYRRAQQADPGIWKTDAVDPQPCESAEAPFLICEACQAGLGVPDPELLGILSAQVKAIP